jgi:pimeloyl-ACP methyl ester carboxylesterase
MMRRLAVWVLVAAAGLLGACGSLKPFDPVTDDQVLGDKDFPSTSDDLDFTSGGVKLYGLMRIAQGKGPHPTVVAARGTPDPETNVDVLMALRRAGFNTLSFYYRGFWGMGGTYTKNNQLEDMKAAIAALRSEEAAAKFRVDRDRIIVLGYSGGGPIALKAASDDAGIRALVLIDPIDLRFLKDISAKEYESWVAMFDSLTGVRVSGKDLVAEEVRQLDFWDPIAAVPSLTGRCVLAVMATRGVIADLSKKIGPPAFADAMRGNEKFSLVTLDTDHGFDDRRIALTRSIVSWAQGLQAKSCL